MTDLDRWLQAATSPEHKDYRAAIRALAQLGPSIATQIVELLRSRGGDAVMPVVLRWPGAAVVEHLAPLLAGKDHEAAWRATHLLGQSRAAEAVAPLVAQLERSGRQMAARALGECGQAAAVAPLLAHAATLIAGTDNVDAMADEDPAAPEQLAHVLHALGRLGDSSLAPWLVRLADTAPEPQEREAAVLALADVPVAEALAVASRALGGSTGPLRRAGLYTLWSYRTVAAVDALLAAAPPEELVVDVEAMILDIAGVAPERWPAARASLPAGVCLCEGAPLTADPLLARARDEARRPLALRELARVFGFSARWNAVLDDEADLYRELAEWKLREGACFTPGLLLRGGREVPAERAPQPLPS